MDLSHVPGFISAKLAAFSDARATAAIRADQLTQELADLRARWAGTKYRASDDRTDFPREVEVRLEEQKLVTARLATFGKIIDDCRAWLASLPANATLEQVAVEIETGITLPTLRAQIARFEAEVKALKQVPLPAVDIKQKVEAYIVSLTKPIIHGVAAGEQLVVEWPKPRDQFAAAPHVDLFTMVAFLEPDKFAARLLAAIHKNAPPADRDEQIKKLETRIENLQRAEETLVVTTGAARIGGRPPQVILGCKIVTATRGKAAA